MERAGFDLPSFCKIIHKLSLQFNSSADKDLDSLAGLLYSHGFLLSRGPFRGQFQGNTVARSREAHESRPVMTELLPENDAR
jgi:hypothetical protein